MRELFKCILSQECDDIVAIRLPSSHRVSQYLFSSTEAIHIKLSTVWVICYFCLGLLTTTAISTIRKESTRTYASCCGNNDCALWYPILERIAFFFSVPPTLIRPTPVTRRPCVNEISCQIFYNLQTSSCPWHKWTIWYICWMLIAHVWTSRMNELLILLNWETVCGYHCSNSYFSFDRWIRNHRWSESLLNDAAGTYL